MTTSRRGKIARLPKTVRAELNQRLENGAPGKPVLAWLNGLPEVQAMVAAEFGGKPIREQNLSEWRKGGYRDWLVQQDALELAARLGEDAVELQAEGRPPLTDTLALWLAARYAVATRQVSGVDGAEGWRQLREFCADIVELRRGDHSRARLKIEQERLERERERTEEEVLAHFERWAEKQEVRDWICQAWLSPEERRRRIRVIWGLAPEEPEAAPGASETAASADAAGPPATAHLAPLEPVCPQRAGDTQKPAAGDTDQTESDRPQPHQTDGNA